MERLWNYVLDLQKLPRGCVVKELNMAPVLVIWSFYLLTWWYLWWKALECWRK